MSEDTLYSDRRISSIVLPVIVTTAQRLGIDIQKILRDVGISIKLDTITLSTIELSKVYEVIVEVEKASGNPVVGLLIGETFDFEYLPHLKICLLSASTPREAFETALLLQELISPLLNLTLQETEKETGIVLKPVFALTEEGDRRYTEILFGAVRTIGNRLMRKTTPPLAVHFRHNRSELAAHYADYFGCAIVLNAPENAIIYASGLIDSPLSGGAPEIRKHALNVVLQQQADSRLSGGPAQHVKKLLTARGDKLHTVEEVARALHMSTRTLQRRLAETGKSLVEIRDEIRYQLAVEALRTSRFSIEEIGERLGFSDRQSFARAFKRWSGLSPAAYRKNPPDNK